MSLLDRLRHRLRKPSAGASREAPRGRAAAVQPATALEEAPAHPFAPFALALGVEIPQAVAPGPDEAEADRALAAQILEHFRKNRPGPTSFPALSLQILNLVASAQAEMSEISRLIGRDPAMSAGVLSVANSAYYRAVQEIETVREAVARLGLEEVGRVAGAVSAKTLFSPRLRAEQAAFGERFTELFGHAVVVASGAAWLALRTSGARSDRAYLGGLLHDVGKSIALRSVASLVAEGSLPRPDEQRLERAIDAVHVEVGGLAHQEWNLPQYLTAMAVRHHDPEVPSDPEFVDLHAVRLASGLEDLQGPFAARAVSEVVQSARALGADPFLVRSLQAELREAKKRTAALVGSPAAPAARKG